ncbi:MAG: GAF domain-containing protein [Chloroflexota bacterium]
MLLLVAPTLAWSDKIAVLAQHGYGVTAVTTPPEATALITQPHAFDLIILQHPFTTDIALLLHTVQTQPNPLPVLALVAADDPQQNTWFDAPVADYLLGTVDFRVLHKRIDFLLTHKQLQAQIAERDHILTVLQNITQASLEGLDRQTLLNSLAQHLGELFKAEGCYLTQWSEQEQMVKPIAAYGPLQDTYPQMPASPGIHTITHDVLLTGQPLLVPHLPNSPYKGQPVTTRLPNHSLLALPLIVDEHKLGAVIITYPQEYPFSTTDVAYARQIAAQIGLALARINSVLQEHEQRELAETLREITNALNSSLTLSAVLDVILEQLVRVIPYSSASIMLLQDGVLQSAARRSTYAGGLRGTTLQVDKFAHVQAVITSHNPVIVSDTSQDERWQNLPPQHSQLARRPLPCARAGDWPAQHQPRYITRLLPRI